MKSFLLLSILTLTSINVSAANVNELMSKLDALSGQSGELVSYDRSNSGYCEVVFDRGATGGTLYLEGTGQYFTPLAHVFLNNISVEDGNTLLVSTNSDRPGGDACGDAGGAFRYKKRIIVEDNSVEIVETYRCAFRAFKKYTLSSKCTF